MWLSRLGKTLLGTAIGVVTFLIICLALFQQSQIKKSTLTFIEAKVHEKTGWRVKIEDVEGLLPLQFRVKNLHVTAPDESTLTIEMLHLLISPWQLLKGHLCVHFADLQNVKIAEQLPALNMSGTLDLSKKKTSLRIKLLGFSEGMLARKSPFEIDILLAGHPSAWRQVVQQPDRNRVEKSLSGSFMSKSSYFNATVSESFAGEFKLTGNRSVYLDKVKGVISKEETPVISVEGDLTLHADNNLYSNLVLQANELEALSELFPIPVKGPATFTTVIAGNSEKKNISITLISPELSIDNHPFHAVEIKSQTEIVDNLVQSDLEGFAYLDELPVHSFLALSWNMNELLELPKFRLEIGDNSLAGDLKMNLLTTLVEGTVEAFAPQLSDISLFSREELSGSATLKLNFLSDRIEAVGIGADLTYGDNNFEEIHIEGTIKELAKGALKVSASNSRLFANSYRKIDLSTEIDITPGHQELWPYAIALQAADGSHFESTGSWQTDNLAHPVTLSLITDHCEGSWGKHPFALTKPVTFSSTPEITLITPLALKIGEGTFFAELSYTRERLLFNLEASQLPLGLMSHFNDKLSDAGTITLNSKLHGKPSDISGTIEVNFQGMNFEELALSRVPAFDGAFNATLKNERLNASGALTGLVHWPITFDAELPFAVSLSPPKAVCKLDDPIAAQFRFEGEIAPIFQLLIANTTSITGEASSTINVNGTLAQPRISGEMEIRNGSYESLLLGGVFKNLNATIVGEGNQLKLVDLKAEDGDQGTVTATGHMQFDPENAFPYEMTVAINRSNLLHLDYAKGTATGHLILKGNMEKRVLSGALEVDEMTIRIPEEVPTQLSGIEITYINMPPDERQPTHYQKKKKPKPVALDIMLHAPKNLFITKKDFSSEWKGSIHFGGIDDQMLLEGELQSRSGTYQINGKTFDLNSGTITFAGDPANKTSLYLTASQQIDDINVDLILKGPIKKPIVTFRSNPPFSQKEILSLILFNRAASDITASQNAQLNQSIVTLSGGEEQSSLLGKIRQSFGIDRIDIGSKDTADANEVTLRIGKYLSKKIFLSVNKGINSETNQVSIEAKLSRQFKAQAEINSDAEGRMTLRWQKDY